MADRFKEYFDDGDPDKIFILEEEIASGSFGSVYKGRHFQTGVHYAVKIITPEEDEVLDDFMVEISVLKKCSNPNIVGYFGAWLKGEELFIAMELCEGGAITDIFSVCQDPLDEDQIAIITKETLKALSYLHHLGIIHRDIKGANILLTNSGDIKLVDFGVSAELKHPGDRRNTLIGTPYWMSPEVIANKTGNVPYDTKADMWSLGITLLELADMNPPLHEIHPMKALMMIPMRDPPTFQNPEKWSREFRDFVNICLRKAPEKRQTADEMLKHPFVTNTKDKSVLIDLINKRKRLEALEQNDREEEEEEESDEESETSDEEGSSSPPAKTQPPKSTPTPTPHVPVPEHKASTTAHDVSPSPKKDDSKIVSTPSKIEHKDGGSKIQQPQDPKKNAEKGTGRGNLPSSPSANKPNRPTYRTNKKMTARQIKEHEQNILDKKMVQKRLQEIRALNKEHETQEKRLSQKQTKDQTGLKESLDTKLANLRKQQAAELKKMVDAQKTEREALEKEVSSNARRLEREQKATAEKVSKKLTEESKSATKEFKKELKQDIAKEEEKLKKDKVPKPEREQKARESKNLAEWKEKIFVDKQARDKFEKDYDQRHADLQAHYRHVRSALGDKHARVWRQMLERQNLELDQLQSAQQNELERLKQIQPQEMSHLIERYDLLRKQLQEQQKMESEQQQKILLLEQKNQKNAHKKAQNKKKEELNNEIRKILKEDKKGGKAKSDELRGKLKSELDQEDLVFNQKQQKQREEEETMIQRHQQAKETEFEDTRKGAVSKLESEQTEQRKKLQEDHKQQEKDLLKKHIQEQKDLQKDFHEELRASLVEYHKVLADSLKDYLQAQRKLYEDQHKEQTTLKQKQKCEESEIQLLIKDHEEDFQLLSQKQQKEVEIQEQQNTTDKNELEELLAKQKKQLDDEHNSDNKTSLTSLKSQDIPPGTPDLKKKGKSGSPVGSVRGNRGSKDVLPE